MFAERPELVAHCFILMSIEDSAVVSFAAVKLT